MTSATTAAFDKIASGICLEGLAIDQARGVVWCSGVIGGGIRGVTHDGTSAGSFNAGRMWTGGVMLNHGCAVLSSGEDGIMWNHPEPADQDGWSTRSTVHRSTHPAPLRRLRRSLSLLQLGSPRRGDTLKEGGAMTATNSFLYRTRSDTPGLPVAPASFDLA